MAKNLTNVRVYGDTETDAFFALPGEATLPTTIGEPGPPFQGVGWLADGSSIDLELTTEVSKFKGMQGGAVLRTKVTSSEKSFKVQCVEESPLVTGMHFGHGAPTVTGTGTAAVARVDLPESVPTVERAAVVRFVDQGVEKLLVCELVQATDRGTIVHQNTEMTVYEITFEIIGDCYILTNSPAYLDGADEEEDEG